MNMPEIPQKIIDLVVLMRSPRELLQQIISEIEKLAGMVKPHQIIEIIQHQSDDLKVQTAVFNVLSNLEANDIEDSVADLKKWFNLNADESDSMPEAEVTRLKENLSALLKPLPAIGKMKRLTEALDLVAYRVSGLHIFWQPRPIFAPDHVTLDGFLQLATLRITYEDHGKEQGGSFQLTKAALGKLIEQATAAQKELESLEARLAAPIAGGNG